MYSYGGLRCEYLWNRNVWYIQHVSFWKQSEFKREPDNTKVVSWVELCCSINERNLPVKWWMQITWKCLGEFESKRFETVVAEDDWKNTKVWIFEFVQKRSSVNKYLSKSYLQRTSN